MVNDQGDLVAVTQGGDRGAQALNYFLDVSEVRRLLHTRAYTWTDGTGRLGARTLPGAVVLKLAGLVQHKNPKIRLQAVTLLGEAGANPRLAIPALCKALKEDDSKEVRREAAAALGQLGREASSALPDLTHALKDQDREVRLQTLKALNQIGPKGADLSKPLMDCLADKDGEIQEQALQGLWHLGADAEKAVPALAIILEGPERNLRKLAVDVLERIGAAGQPAAAAALQRVLDKFDFQGQVQILRLLARWRKLEQVGKTMLLELQKNLQSSDPEMRLQNLILLEILGPEAKKAIPAIERIYLHDKQRGNRLQALKTIAAMGKEAEKAVPTLMVDFKDLSLRKNDNEIYEQIYHTLVKIGKPAVRPVLSVALRNPTPFYRIKALEIIGEIGPESKEIALEPLTIQLRSREQDPKVRAVLAATIEKIK